ncbi:uncharacterized protein LOC117332251 [Pecten maximus]|uniref:uncharacterized protein LOC117332251 n=1 Tax=Pecten maximus TaxID=6579 RepID=UPI001458E8F4|nr:uncharacterized protein LOC117332251 [Pecten maximus]
MERFRGIILVVCLSTYGGVTVLGDFADVLQLSVPIFNSDVISENETITTLQTTRNILKMDLSVSDINFDESLIEVGVMVDNIILKYKYNPPVATTVLLTIADGK